MEKRVRFVLICLLTSAILVACGPSQAERDAQATKIAADIFATQTVEAPTPMPTSTLTSISPPTLTLTPTSTVTPVPPTTGVVRGVLIDESTGQPVLNERVVLGVVDYDEDGKPVGYEIEAKEGGLLRYAYTDTTGAFIIETQPGTYVLVSPGGSPLDKIARDDTGTALIIKVNAGQSVDLGKIQTSP